jgi:hypothetical protein
MRPEDQARAIHLPQQLSLATRDPTQSLDRSDQVGDHSHGEKPSSIPTREAAIRATHVIADVHAAATAAAVTRDQQVADFVSNTGVEAHAAATSAGASEEEAAYAAHTVTGAIFVAARADIAEAEATASSAT